MDSTMIHTPLDTNQPTKCEVEDREIEKLAAQIREENKKRISQLVPMSNNTQPLNTSIPTAITLFKDGESRQGKFGWAQFDDKYIPYLMRSQKQYVAMDILENNVFCKFNQFFTEELYSCFQVDNLKMTAVEAKLFNEINFVHCDNSLGRFVFPDTGLLISLDSAKEMHEFLNFCYEKLIQKSVNTDKGFGFIRIDSQNCIPYVCFESKQYAPLFYFDGECQYLEERSVLLKGRELAYMKLCCKIQGVRKSLFDHANLRVVDLELVKKFFPPETPFEYFWPAEHKMETLILSSAQRTNSNENNQRNSAQKAPRKQPPAKKLPSPKPSPYPINNIPVRRRKTTSSIPEIGNSKSSYSNPSVTSSLPPEANLMAQLKPFEFPDKNKNLKCKFYQIPDFSFKKGSYPYFLIRSQVGDVSLNHCINLFPSNSTVVLVTLEEVAANVFRKPVTSIIRAVNYLRIDLYFPNMEQIKLLRLHKMFPVTSMLKLEDFIDNINSITSFISASKFS